MNVSVSDFALVFQDGKLIKSLDRSQRDWHILLLFSLNENSKFHILV